VQILAVSIAFQNHEMAFGILGALIGKMFGRFTDEALPGEGAILGWMGSIAVKAFHLSRPWPRGKVPGFPFEECFQIFIGDAIQGHKVLTYKETFSGSATRASRWPTTGNSFDHLPIVKALAGTELASGRSVLPRGFAHCPKQIAAVRGAFAKFLLIPQSLRRVWICA